MAEKKPDKSQEAQHERFRTAIREMIDAGELSPTDADEAFSRLIQSSGGSKPSPSKHS
jgi:hypothetical protein